MFSSLKIPSKVYGNAQQYTNSLNTEAGNCKTASQKAKMKQASKIQTAKYYEL